MLPTKCNNKDLLLDEMYIQLEKNFKKGVLVL